MEGADCLHFININQYVHSLTLDIVTRSSKCCQLWPSFCLLIVDVFIFKGLWSCYRGGDWCKPWVCTSWSRKLLVFASYVVYTLHKLFLLPKYAVSVFLEQVCRFVKASISWFSPTIEHRYTCILWTNSGINTFSTFFFVQGFLLFQ